MELRCTSMVLIPKGNADTKGFGMLEVFWKVVEAVIHTHIKSIVQFHDVLHGFCAVRGAGPLLWSLN